MSQEGLQFRIDLELCEERAELLNRIYGAGAPAVLRGAETGEGVGQDSHEARQGVLDCVPVLAALSHA
jgi:hypothetical protein